MLVDLSKSLQQAEFGALVGIAQPTVSELVTSGVLPSGATGHAWLLAYTRRLREQAAGRAGNGDLDLVQERAALARSQRIQTELKTATVLREYAPVALLESILATAGAAVADRIDGIEGLLKKIAPDLPEPTRAALLSTFAAARNEWVRSTARLLEQQFSQLGDADDEPASTLQAPSESEA